MNQQWVHCACFDELMGRAHTCDNAPSPQIALPSVRLAVEAEEKKSEGDEDE